jgi:hypothetical protein
MNSDENCYDSLRDMLYRVRQALREQNEDCSSHQDIGKIYPLNDGIKLVFIGPLAWNKVRGRDADV